MKAIYIVVLILLSIKISAKCQDSVYSRIDEQVKKVSKTKIDRLDLLVSQLIKGAINDHEKVRAIYEWIKINIKYDTIKSDRIMRSDTKAGIDLYPSAEKVMELKEGICYDYSVLGKKMFNIAGFDCDIIVGVARDFNNKIQYETDTVSHAWNAIRIHGEWFLIDLTWASSDYHNAIEDDFYFLTDPRMFIASHFPYDLKWQLLDKSCSLKEFMDFPYVKKAFFENSHNEFPRQGIFKSYKNYIEIPDFSDMNDELSFELLGESSVVSPFTVESISRNNLKIYKITFKHKGKFQLSIGIKKSDGFLTVNIKELVIVRVSID